ncbi:unnamed protein product [Boreogadus saida]
MITLEPDCLDYHLLRYPGGVEGSQDRRVVGLLLLSQEQILSRLRQAASSGTTSSDRSGYLAPRNASRQMNAERP